MPLGPAWSPFLPLLFPFLSLSGFFVMFLPLRRRIATPCRLGRHRRMLYSPVPSFIFPTARVGGRTACGRFVAASPVWTCFVLRLFLFVFFSSKFGSLLIYYLTKDDGDNGGRGRGPRLCCLTVDPQKVLVSALRAGRDGSVRQRCDAP